MFYHLITMISMQKKRWKWNIGQQVYWSCLKSFKRLSFCKNCNGANAHGFLTYLHDFQSLVDPYYTAVGHIWSPTLYRGDTWWSFFIKSHTYGYEKLFKYQPKMFKQIVMPFNTRTKLVEKTIMTHSSTLKPIRSSNDSLVTCSKLDHIMK